MGALVRLQFAYEMNLTELSENGKIQYTTSDGELMTIETYERNSKGCFKKGGIGFGRDK